MANSPGTIGRGDEERRYQLTKDERTFGYLFSKHCLLCYKAPMPTPATEDPCTAPDAMLDALLNVFSAKGYEGASLQELATACSRSKASLYHHFPGGKAQMIEQLIARCRDSLDQQAFAGLVKLKGKKSARSALEQFIDGFARYLQQHQGNCLLATLALTQPGLLGDRQAEQSNRWLKDLSRACEQLGHKPKAARRLAQASLARLYGSLTLAALGSSVSMEQACKWLKRDLLG